jgi:hypothetical protein
MFTKNICGSIPPSQDSDRDLDHVSFTFPPLSSHYNQEHREDSSIAHPHQPHPLQLMQHNTLQSRNPKRKETESEGQENANPHTEAKFGSRPKRKCYKKKSRLPNESKNQVRKRAPTEQTSFAQEDHEAQTTRNWSTMRALRERPVRSREANQRSAASLGREGKETSGLRLSIFPSLLNNPPLHSQLGTLHSWRDIVTRKSQ